MTCSKCGYEVPANALFCTNCGNRINSCEEAPAVPNTTKTEYSAPPTEQPISPKAPKMPKSKLSEYIKNNLLLLIIAAALLTSAIVLTICTVSSSSRASKLENLNQSLFEEIDRLNKEIEASKQDKDDLSAFYQDELEASDELKEEFELLQEKYSEALASSMLYEDRYFGILDSLNTSNIGMASETFYLSDGILVLYGGDNAKVELYTLKNHGTIDIETNGTSAALSFCENEWDSQTILNISAKESGVTVFSITDSTELEPLKLIVIVQ